MFRLGDRTHALQIAVLNPCLATGWPAERATLANDAVAVVGGDGVTNATAAEGGSVGNVGTGSPPPTTRPTRRPTGRPAGAAAADAAPAAATAT
jgi:hypothetical protein